MTQFLSRGIDYLGDLGAKLRDLRGYGTLAYELIQNADDARDATWMTFDVREDALVVDNNGRFSDCSQIDQPDCPWKADAKVGHRCDFHRFRHIASGDKRGEPGTTGAFGIGFIAVYQVTDRPELLSSGRHWILREDQPEDQRIEVCPGCPNCAQSGLPGTRFILPWARDPDSQLRRALRADPVPTDGSERILDELERSLPIGMLFLKRLRAIEIRRAGGHVREFQRLDDGESLVLSDGRTENDRIWHIVRGDFDDAAKELRAEHPGRIETKRSSLVTLAIPAKPVPPGLLCACLPTEDDVGLPFHFNADFFPTNDRKRVIFGDDYQAAWNRAALGAGAKAIGQAVDSLRKLLGAEHFWGVVSNLKEVADATERGHGEKVLAEFWKVVQPRLRTAPVVYTTTGRWTTAAEALVLLQREEAPAIPILEALGIAVVSEELRPHQGLLRSEAIGVRLLSVGVLCEALKSQGLDRRVELHALPPGLSTPLAREALWHEIAVLLEHQQRNPRGKADDEHRLREIAIAPGRDSALWPCGEIYSADEVTAAFFEPLGLNIPFVAADVAFAPLTGLCRPFNVVAVIEALQTMDGGQLESAWQQGRLPLRPLFEWFENHRGQIFSDGETKGNLAALQLYPSSGSLQALDRLALPGNFDDPLGLAQLVDLDALGDRRDFLRDLGMRELDFRTYAVDLVPAALNATSVPPEKRRAAAILLGSRAGELRDDEDARGALASTRLVECADGEFREAHECYFDTSAVRVCLGDDSNFATLPTQHEAAVRDLYEWLGVADEPRLEDIVTVVREWTGQPYSAAVALRIQNTVAHLGQRLEGGEDATELNPLQRVKWLPARGRTDRWYSPHELYAIYQVYLFESQALVLDAPANVQTASRALLQFLGVRLAPPVALVVRHLIHCATHQTPVNAEVYRFLNDNVDDPTLSQLHDKKCLLLDDTYRAPSEVFWSEHPFGRYRWRLGDELRGYSNLLKHLGVRDSPNHEDALNVLKEISSQFSMGNLPLDGEAHAVLMAGWRMLDKALADGAVSTEDIAALSAVKCVPRTDGVLHPPEWMFFENRAGLAAKFGAFLTANVIPRPLGAGSALGAAGVRRLGSAVQIELLECNDPIDDPILAERIRARRNEIGRVLDSQAAGQAADALSGLDSMTSTLATGISIRYRVGVFNREWCSEPEHVPALYQPDQQTLLFTRREGHTPWPAIARELAIALFPEEDPGRFAAGLKEVLAAESAADASAILDELGLAPLDTSVLDVSTGAEPVSTLGTETPLVEGSSSSGSPGASTTPEPADLTTEDALNRLLGAGAQPPTPPVQDPTAEVVGTGGASDTTRRSSAAAKQGRPVLRSYLPAPDVGAPESADQNDKEGMPEGSSVDEAGVRHVLDYETATGRIPKAMPHNHPGYDVESRDHSGKVVRYIEVKSFSGRWSNTYADLSRKQFDKATDVRDVFWLYVVERAESEDFRIYCIQNPALKANHFMFDDGWRALAEPAPSEGG